MKYKWLDHASSSEWKSLEEIKKWADEVYNTNCTTTGKKILETKDYIVVSSESDGSGNFGNSTLIFKKLLINEKTKTRGKSNKKRTSRKTT